MELNLPTWSKKSWWLWNYSRYKPIICIDVCLPPNFVQFFKAYKLRLLINRPTNSCDSRPVRVQYLAQTGLGIPPRRGRSMGVPFLGFQSFVNGGYGIFRRPMARTFPWEIADQVWRDFGKSHQDCLQILSLKWDFWNHLGMILIQKSGNKRRKKFRIVMEVIQIPCAAACWQQDFIFLDVCHPYFAQALICQGSFSFSPWLSSIMNTCWKQARNLKTPAIHGDGFNGFAGFDGCCFLDSLLWRFASSLRIQLELPQVLNIISTSPSMVMGLQQRLCQSMVWIKLCASIWKIPAFLECQC